MGSESEIDRLYSLPPGEFVPARNALAKSLRAAGDRPGADEVKALAKPSVTAWAVNRLWFEERKEFDRLLAAGEAEREALVGGTASGARATAERRAALKGLMAAARRLLAAAGHPLTPAARQRISNTLEAVAAIGADAVEPPLGRLARDLEPQGFDALAGLALSLAPAAGRPASKARSKPPRDAVRPARASLRSAADKRRLEAARKALEDRRAELAAAEKEAEKAEQELVAARRRAESAASAANEAEERARRAAETSARSRQAEAEAERAARVARTTVRRAGGRLETARRRLGKLDR